MKILVTGAKGFVGRNLCENLKNLRDGKNRTRPALTVDEIYEYDIDTDPVLLEEYCAKADFVFNLAGVNRPKNEAEFMQGNFGFASTLLDMLKRHGNTCPVASSQPGRVLPFTVGAVSSPQTGSRPPGASQCRRHTCRGFCATA